MIWDFFSRGQEPSFYETAYGPLGYARRYDGVEMVRMPVEADVEYLFVEGVYFAWKSTADDAWMGRQLDAAIRAMDYSFTDRARFSTKYGLVKRGYTIDTWDFQIDDATTRDLPALGDAPRRPRPLEVRRDVRRQHRLRRVLRLPRRDAGARGAPAGRGALPRSAGRTCASGSTGWPGSARTSATGCPEDETVVRDVGVNEREQVSLSNTYSLNRGISARAGRGDPPHVPEDPRLAAAGLARASGTRSTRPSRRASATTPSRGST